ncbi:hypothetical protein ONZ45_g10053 [Pleurotus djamor]|nr:hypothetical protein ONZ45_g10053 [Pleurotus djamor]
MDPAAMQALQQIAQNTSTLPALLPALLSAIQKLDNRLEGIIKTLDKFTASVDRQTKQIQDGQHQVHHIADVVGMAGSTNSIKE